MFNIGFDCNVVDTTSKLKKIKFIGGSLAYFISIFITLIKKDGADLTIEVDGEIKNNGKLLLTAISNGCYYGGGIKCSPSSLINDGWININIIHNISRINFISKLPFYMKGTHPKLKGIEKIIYSKKCKNVVITPKNRQMRLCIDGEITDAQKTTLEVVKNAFMFVIPKK